MVEEGKPAPEFELLTDEGERVKLSDFRGRPVVLYFYPRDDTPGCTKQACGIRDAYDAFRERGAVVLGVSADTQSSHVKFKTKYELPFTLLADPERVTGDDFMVSVGIERTRAMPRAGGDAVEIVQRGWTMARRGADGRWRFARGITNREA